MRPNEWLFDNLIDDDESEERFLTTDEAALYLGVTVGTVRNMVCRGELPYYKLGRRNRYKLSELKNLLQSNKRGGFRYGI